MKLKLLNFLIIIIIIIIIIIKPFWMINNNNNINLYLYIKEFIFGVQFIFFTFTLQVPFYSNLTYFLK